MGEEVEHNCGLCVAHTLHDIHKFMKSLQHRGREAAGIAAIGDDRIDVLKWQGLVSAFDIVDLHKIFPGYNFHTFLGHLRYATRGRKDKILEDAHPHIIGGTVENRGNHILIRDCDAAIVHNGQVSIDDYIKIDKEKLKTDCDSEALLHYYREIGEIELMRKVPESYTLAIADKRKKDVIVARDRFGMKPGVLGLKDGKYCVVSEDVAIRENGGEFVENLNPGFLYYLSSNGSFKKERILDPKLKRCFFEWNYIANVDSNLDNESVRSVRISLGEMLAEEFLPPDADYVTYLPRCPETAARSYADKTGIPFIEVFYKMRGERSFLGSTAEDRAASIKDNLHLLPGIEKIIQGKTLVIIDDSTIRGNNSLRASTLLDERVKLVKKYIQNYTSKIGIVGTDGVPRGCVFGVDMPPNDDFIIRKGSDEEISRILGANIYFITFEGMLRGFEKVGIDRNTLCTYCIGGKHPFHE